MYAWNSFLHDETRSERVLKKMKIPKPLSKVFRIKGRIRLFIRSYIQIVPFEKENNERLEA